MSNFRELLKLVVIESEADDILATRIPDLCPDCEGEGVVFCADDDDIGDGCDHPNAPTIGDLLRWGENVAKAEPHPGITPYVLFDHPTNGPTAYQGPIVLLAALRTEDNR